jgi:hypothetical protein
VRGLAILNELLKFILDQGDTRGRGCEGRSSAVYPFTGKPQASRRLTLSSFLTDIAFEFMPLSLGLPAVAFTLEYIPGF